MELKYEVYKNNDYLSSITSVWTVKAIKTIFGKRVSVDESEPNKTIEMVVYEGNLSDCHAWIKLKEGGYIK